MKSFPGWVHLASFFLAVLLVALCGIILEFPFTPKTLQALLLMLSLIATPTLLSLLWGLSGKHESFPPASGCLMMVFGWMLLLGLLLTHVMTRMP